MATVAIKIPILKPTIWIKIFTTTNLHICFITGFRRIPVCMPVKPSKVKIVCSSRTHGDLAILNHAWRHTKWPLWIRAACSNKVKIAIAMINKSPDWLRAKCLRWKPGLLEEQQDPLIIWDERVLRLGTGHKLSAMVDRPVINYLLWWTDRSWTICYGGLEGKSKPSQQISLTSLKTNKVVWPTVHVWKLFIAHPIVMGCYTEAESRKR